MESVFKLIFSNEYNHYYGICLNKLWITNVIEVK